MLVKKFLKYLEVSTKFSTFALKTRAKMLTLSIAQRLRVGAQAGMASLALHSLNRIITPKES
jgi:hypothetical protein